ncbi:hypothetical protein BSZ19_46925 [Bradyrhizobium japonicum]|uniref:Uncharacterized protein n=1 Tax=Bradyrhizobium japonicum TaxID=375 RepID=A0A1Y2J7P5_BRAJP|nr:hypothetical protein [Bradyrhizobium japonicum]OSJ22128.1 hypothetical protein BSZ19_46925 [Bradyrhizobium japonicum]
MITITVTSENSEQFTVRFQTRSAVGEDGSVTWQDSEVAHAAGKSQLYGIDENFRLIIESFKPDQPAGQQ